MQIWNQLTKLNLHVEYDNTTINKSMPKVLLHEVYDQSKREIFHINPFSLKKQK